MNIKRTNDSIGILCHEHGCPDKWRDETRECEECGTAFQPEERDQQFCSDHCEAMYCGDRCNCESCREERCDDDERSYGPHYKRHDGRGNER